MHCIYTEEKERLNVIEHTMRLCARARACGCVGGARVDAASRGSCSISVSPAAFKCGS